MVDTLRNLLAAHDCDPRYSNPDTKGRVAALYLPLLAIVMDSLPILYYTSSEPHRGNGGNSSDEAFFINNPINQTVAMAIAGTTKTITTATNYYDPYQQVSFHKSIIHSERDSLMDPISKLVIMSTWSLVFVGSNRLY